MGHGIFWGTVLMLFAMLLVWLSGQGCLLMGRC